MNNFPETHLDLLKDETRALAYLATIMSDGSPQVTPIWFNVSGEYILINSARGRLKDRNMRARPQVALAIADPKNPYRYVQIRGQVVEISSEGSREHINALAKKYHDQDIYGGPAAEERFIYKIKPEKIQAMG